MASTVIGSPREPPEHGACLACHRMRTSNFVNLETISREHDTQPLHFTGHGACAMSPHHVANIYYISMSAILDADAQTPITS